MKKLEKRISALERTVKSAAARLESANFYEYVDYVADEKRMLKRAFAAGVFRGLGMAIGFSLLGAVVIYLLRLLAESRVPYIAKLVSRIVEIVEAER